MFSRKAPSLENTPFGRDPLRREYFDFRSAPDLAYQLTNVIAFFRLGNFISVIEIPLLSNCRAVAYDDDEDDRLGSNDEDS